MKALFTLIVAALFAIAPFLSPEFGGFDPDRYPVPQIDPPVQPAGYAFAIWGVIYLWLVVHAIIGFWTYRNDPQWDRTRPSLIISLGVGAVWLPVALVSPVWATVMIWIMLISALSATHKALDGAPGWALKLPLGLYAGWLTAASFVSIGLLGAGYGIVLDQVGWAWAMLVAGFVTIAYFQVLLKGTWTYGLAAGWGLLGIMAQNWGDNLGLTIAAGVAALLVLALAARQIRN